MRARRLLLASLLFVAGPAVAAEGDVPLEALLARTRALEAERVATACRWTETIRLEQLDDKGAVTGSVARTWSVVARGAEVSRTKTSERIEGEISSLLREERAPKKREPGDRFSVFHPEASTLFDFALVSRGEQGVVVSFAPKEPGERRMTGTAELDPASGRVLRMSMRPSKLPGFLDRLAMELRLAPGPCGNYPRVVVAEGAGGFLFFKTRFRTRTELAEFARVEP